MMEKTKTYSTVVMGAFIKRTFIKYVTTHGGGGV